ncbi:MAG: ATP-binding protein [Deltaproteobacteria bacterium]|nr:ATP-binding protein [Deltaproteobacteria bacterium]
MFTRALTETLQRYAKFPVVALLGPRQSGKTTLVQSTFPNHKFLSLDNEVTQAFALEDPEGFLLTNENEHGLILDEFQYAPKLTTYIKLDADKKKRPGYFILTGSQNFLVNKAITESLAGRVGILNLLPLSNKEILENKLASESISEVIFNGGYPRIYAEKILPTEFYPSYILSYIQRDVGQLINPKNMTIFHRFVQLCAGRIGQLCNVSALAAETGISAPTAKEWLSILEASYILFFLEPHFQNFNKRLVKTPKLYFFDTGLACSLLRIDSPGALSNSHFQGSLFESLIIADFYKQYCNQGSRPSIYFWRDNGGAHEIDCILDHGTKSYPVEIKAGKSVASDSFRGLDYWNELAGADPHDSYLIYANEEKQLRKQGNVIGWKDSSSLINIIIGEKKGVVE